jgi:hypothetical protein
MQIYKTEYSLNLFSDYDTYLPSFPKLFLKHLERYLSQKSREFINNLSRINSLQQKPIINLNIFIFVVYKNNNYRFFILYNSAKNWTHPSFQLYFGGHFPFNFTKSVQDDYIPIYWHIKMVKKIY